MSYAAIMERAGYVNVFALLEEAAQLARIKQVLDARAAWTAATESEVPPTVEERVKAVLIYANERSAQ